jgi:subtilisin family serine protease
MKAAIQGGVLVLLFAVGWAMAADEPNSTCGCAAKSESQTAGVSEGKLINRNHIMRGFEEGQERVNVIVNLAEPAETKAKMNWQSRQSRQLLRDEIRAIQAPVLSEMGGDEFKMRYRFDNQAGFSGEVTLKGLEKLENDPRVVSVEPVYILEPHLRQGIPLMRADTYRSSYNGEGVAIAICDTGIDYTHPMLGGGGFPNSKVIGGYDFGDTDANPMPDSTQGHGTCCAGIAAGSLGNTGDYIGGVAYNAKLYALKITAGSSSSAMSDAMINAWNWCITHQDDNPDYPILAISTSFGGDRFYSACDGQAGTTAINNVVAAGITALASAGNDGYCDSIAWPACISNMISVGAVYDASFGTIQPCINAASCATKHSTSDCTTGYYAIDSTVADMVTSYSNMASFLTLLAPSNQCYTTDIVGSGGYSSGDYHSSFGGTSAASPYAAGAVACLQSAAKAIRGDYLTPSEVRTILTSTGDSITDGKVAITKPRVNLERAINNLYSTPTAQNINVTTPLATALTISLQASDDGWPNPPGALSYIITSLPSGGSLNDPGAGGIIAVPYTLVNHGNLVVYTPAVGYAGPDSFMFKANDGGVPPSGGDSNQATVSVTVGWITIQSSVSASSDDAYSTSSTSINLTNSYLRIGTRSNSVPPYCMSGMRFTNLAIPAQSQIVSAQLNIRSYNSNLSSTVYGVIQGEGVDNAASFSGLSSLSGLATTIASVNWDHLTAWSVDTWYTSPDISTVIQEVIDRPGWAAGNALAVFYSTRLSSGGYRQYSSYDRGAAYAPKLNITYIGPVTLATSSTGNGSVATPGQGTFYYRRGTTVDIAATPQTGYHFVNWTGSGVDAGKVANPDSASTTITMDADYAVAANFTVNTYTISGKVTYLGSGLDGVAMTGLPGNPVTSGGGLYSTIVDYGWNGTVVPVKTDYTFTPGSIAYTNVISNQMNQDYLAVSIYDLDGNGSVGTGDLIVMSQNWLKTPANVNEGNFNNDAIVDLLDFAMFAQHWLEGQ